MAEANPDLAGGILQRKTPIYLEEGPREALFPFQTLKGE